MQLTLAQQKEIEGSIWVVNTALKKQGLSFNEDLRQSAILYMCECITRFDPTKGVKWTTFAYRNIYLYIKKVNAREVKRSKIECGEVLEKDFIAPERTRSLLRELWGLFSPQEQKILKLKLQGYNYIEISEIMQCSLSKVNRNIKRIKSLLLENIRSENENLCR